MLSTKQKVLVAIGVVVLILVVLKMSKSKGMEGLEYIPASATVPVAIGPDPNVSYKSGFLPYSHQGPWFQNLGPSIPMENNYHSCISQDCNGDYGNYGCRQRCYIKTLKNGTTDKTDLICWAHRDDEEKYYDCLDSVYANYIWSDRFTGTQPCLCPDGSQGASTSEGGCHCPPKRPLHDRRPLDNNNEIVTRL